MICAIVLETVMIIIHCYYNCLYKLRLYISNYLADLVVYIIIVSITRSKLSQFNECFVFLKLSSSVGQNHIFSAK